MNNNKIIVFFHIFYVHLIDEYLWYIDNIKKSNYDFDFYVSICKEVYNDDVKNKLVDFKSDVIITISENRGADIGGFFHTIRNNKINIDNYCACMYLHTKESKHFGELTSYIWRGQLLNDTLLTPDLVNYCVDEIKKNTGLIGSSRCINLISKFLSNPDEIIHYKNLCQRLNLNLNSSYFIAGTIFWCNPKIIKNIINSNINISDFEPGFAHNGLLAHAFERIFGNISTNLKLPIVGIYLDIESRVYHLKTILSNLTYENKHIFKINDNNIIIPNQENIIKIDTENRIKKNKAIFRNSKK